MEEILRALGVTYEELKPAELDTVTQWLNDLQAKEITLDDVRKYIGKMKDEVSLALAKEPEGTMNNILLKGRLMNYVLLQAMLSSYPDAKEELDQYISNLKKKQVL